MAVALLASVRASQDEDSEEDHKHRNGDEEHHLLVKLGGGGGAPQHASADLCAALRAEFRLVPDFGAAIGAPPRLIGIIAEAVEVL